MAPVETDKQRLARLIRSHARGRLVFLFLAVTVPLSLYRLTRSLPVSLGAFAFLTINALTSAVKLRYLRVRQPRSTVVAAVPRAGIIRFIGWQLRSLWTGIPAAADDESAHFDTTLHFSQVDQKKVRTVVRRAAAWHAFWLLILPASPGIMLTTYLALANDVGSEKVAAGLGIGIAAYLALLVPSARLQEKLWPRAEPWLLRLSKSNPAATGR